MVWTAAGGVKKNIKAKMLNISLVAGLIASLAVPSLVPLFGNRAEAVELTTQTVHQTDFANSWSTWTYHDDVKDSSDPFNAATPNPTANHQIAANPSPVIGNNGAVKLVASGGQKFNLASLQYSGTKLKDITSLGFDVYTDSPGQAYINLDINFNSWEHGPGTLDHSRLIYVPQGVQANKWSSHEATTQGSWKWSGGKTWPDGVSGARTWDSIIEAFPNAYISRTLAEIFLVKQPFGSLYLRADGDKPVTAYFDNVYLTTTGTNIKYNFELSDPDPENKFGFTAGAVVYRDHVMNDCFGKASCENRAENLKDWEMRLYKEVSPGDWGFIQSKTTDENGVAKFSRQQEAGIYYVCEVLKAGWTQQIQSWPGTPYHVNSDNQSPNSSEEGRHCRSINYADTKSHSNTAYFGNVDDKPPVWNSDPVHLSPADNAEVIEGSNILMQWSDAIDPNGVKYYYQSSYSDETNGSDNGFVNPIWTWGPLTTPKQDATGTAVGTYFWQVKACDDLGNCTDWTNPWTGSVVSTTLSTGGTGGSQVQGARTNGGSGNSNPAPNAAAAAGQTFARAIGGGDNAIGQPQNDEDNDNEGQVEGANIENDFASVPATLAAASVNDSNSCSKILGLCWYYWPPIIVAILTIVYIGYKRTQEEN